MSGAEKQLASPFLTGAGGAHFEEEVQSSFVALMLAGGYSPCLSNWQITKIKLQGRHADYETDDLIVFTVEPNGTRTRKLLGQVKHTISITARDATFREVIAGAWKDFNNAKVFTKGRGGDSLALITGPLSATDVESVRPMLERARSAEGYEEFFRDIDLGRFTSEKTREKLDAFRGHLKTANSDSDVPEEELFEFLRHFHLLGYDLDIKTGVNIALLHTILSNGDGGDPTAVWERIVCEVRSVNQTGGTITLESLPEHLIDKFRKKPAISVPEAFAIHSEKAVTIKWAEDPRAGSLALACLVGEWVESSPGDMETLENLVRGDFKQWQKETRSILQVSDSPLRLQNGHWKVKDRKALWAALSGWIFDEDLAAFEGLAAQVLSEDDPRVEADDGESESLWFTAPKARYSPALRRGVASTVAFLGNRGNTLGKCTLHKPKTTALLIVRKVLDHADAMRWGSLNHLLPTLAEANPNEFLDAVETSLSITPNPFSKLFANESNGVFGRIHITGVLWSLETLAWSDENLVRSAMLLAALAKIDPDGQWANRPKNSLTTIFLPWMPQTLAPFEKQMVAIRTIRKEYPDVAWSLLLSLLPSTHAMSSGSHKPAWRDLTEEQCRPNVTVPDYWKQVGDYATMAMEMAKPNADYLRELLGFLDDLPEHFQDEVSEFLISNSAKELLADDRFHIWRTLVELASRHRRYATADWAMSDARVAKIEETARLLAPTSPRKLHERLFQQDEYDLYDENEDYTTQREKLHQRRLEAIKEIIACEGIEGVIALSQDSESPHRVGFSLGCISDTARDDEMFARFLLSGAEEASVFLSGYIMGRFSEGSWAWVDGIDHSRWPCSAKLNFLLKLPFVPETWSRAASWLAEDVDEYWKKVWVNPHQTQDDLTAAIDKLLEVGRPMRAIDCIYRAVYEKQQVDVGRSVKALLAAVKSDERPSGCNHHHLGKLIHALQKNVAVSEDDLIKIEWAYLQLLGPYGYGKPVTMEKRMACDPGFFCEILRLIYKSRKPGNEDAETSAVEPDETAKGMASNAWKLLRHWSRPPGVTADGEFSEDAFGTWLNAAKEECTETGHLGVALSCIGESLYCVPPAPDGSLWIIPGVASALNAPDHEKMRRGFTCRAFNSRGCHAVDVSGAEYMGIANDWREKAEAVEREGYHRFAASLREFAKAYEYDAERIRTTHLIDESDGD